MRSILLSLMYLLVVMSIIPITGCTSHSNGSKSQEQTEENAVSAIPTDETVGTWEIYKNLDNNLQSNLRNEISYPNYYLIFYFAAPDGSHPAEMNMMLRKKDGKKYGYLPNGTYQIYLGDMEPFEAPNSIEFKFPESHINRLFEILDNGSFDVKIINKDDNTTYNFSVGKQTLGASEAYSKIKDLKIE